MNSYTKKWMSLDQQIDSKLIPRGMQISDREKAKEYLLKIGYYRLSAYWYPFKNTTYLNESVIEQDESFIEQVCFSDVIDLYVFDKKLRFIILDAIERIEVAFRGHIIYDLGRIDRFVYKNECFFTDSFRTKKIRKKTGYERLNDKSKIEYNKKIDDFEGFKKHFTEKYDGNAPIWVVCELWDFGTLSNFFAGLESKYKQKIARQYQISGETLMSWLRSINFIRNICAHHARLWNRNIVDMPKYRVKELPEALNFFKKQLLKERVYVVLCIIAYLIECICPNSSWKKRLKDHLLTLPKVGHISLDDMGFTEDWYKQLLWKLKE